MRKELRPVHELIACDLCGRTILKGERTETFVGAGARREVCELCSFQAVRAGWLREAALAQQRPERTRSRPTHSLWSRALRWIEDQGLRAPTVSAAEAGEAEEVDAGRSEPRGGAHAPAGGARRQHVEPAARERRNGAGNGVAGGGDRPEAPSGVAGRGDRPEAPSDWPEEAVAEAWPSGEPSDFASLAEAGPAPSDHTPGSENGLLDEGEQAPGAPWARRPQRPPTTAALRDLLGGRRREPREIQAVPTSRYGKIERALELFNDSEHRRTIAGIGRALGEPWVSAAPLDDGPGADEVGIVVAWELSWYRYRVHLDDGDQAVLLLDRGDEVQDLEEAQRQWNAEADSNGRLALATESVS